MNRCSNRAAQYVGKQFGIIHNFVHPIDLSPSRTPEAVWNPWSKVIIAICCCDYVEYKWQAKGSL